MTNTKYNALKQFILIKNEIKDDISSYQFDGNTINIKFNNTSKYYSYNSRDIDILDNPIEISIKHNLFYSGNTLYFGIEKALDFGNGYIRIFLRDGRIISKDNIKIVENPYNIKEISKVINYFKLNLKEKGNDEVSEYLINEYGKLNYIIPGSVLHYYLSRRYREKTNLSQLEGLIYPFNFNLSQKKALESVYESNISVIEGPPGTGKTQTILNIIANLAIMQNNSIAVVSGNNSAILNVKEKLEKEGYGFFLAMLGNKENKDRFFSNQPKFKEFEINKVKDYSAKLEEITKLMRLDNERAKLELELSDYILEQTYFDKYYNNHNIDEIFKLPFFINTSDKIINFLAENSHNHSLNKSNNILYKIKIFFKYGFIDFKKLKNKEINLILNYQKKFYNRKIEELEKAINSLNKKLKNRGYKELLLKYTKYSKMKFQNHLNKRFGKIKEVKYDSKNYKKEFDSFIERYPVVLSTTHAILNSVRHGYLFDYLIIDESSQVDLTSGILALSCCKNIIIVGDTKQLQHITNGEKKDTPEDVDKCFNCYEHNILSSVLSIYKNKIPITLLKEHYRCHSKIINFCNQKYYNGELIPYRDDGDTNTPLYIYRTVEGNHMRDVINGYNKGKYNQRELDSVVDIFKNSGLINENDNVGFATPFRKQLEKAKILLGEGIESDTVHKYQGREKDIIIMSTVLDIKTGTKAFNFVDDPYLINVAVSRARNKFILVTDYELFFNKGKEIRDLVKYVEYTTLDENIIESNVIGVFDLLYKNFSSKLNVFKSKVKKISKFESENIMNALIEDILSMKEYDNLNFGRQMLLKNLINRIDNLNIEEITYLNHSASVDFVIYSKFGKVPILIIEVDGFKFHENNPEQLRRDAIKNSILEKNNLPYIRLATNGSGEKEKIINKLGKLLKYDT